ncbi:MAG: hypothetical protein M2R45_00183 [Verrucomicrobia subdivision 3 bacterium]|nr:hypothetical protein [Limisphaerales bacterium]MCS1412358.1 hypothetical protein [Limisphaerales bacterium]
MFMNRDFGYIGDVVELTIRAVETLASRMYNCGSGVFIQRGYRDFE